MGGENKHEAPGTARAARGLQHIGYPEPGDCSLRSSSCRHRLTDASLGRANRSSGFHPQAAWPGRDRKSTRLNSSHGYISYAVFCLKKKTKINMTSKDKLKSRQR